MIGIIAPYPLSSLLLHYHNCTKAFQLQLTFSASSKPSGLAVVHLARAAKQTTFTRKTRIVAQNADAAAAAESKGAMGWVEFPRMSGASLLLMESVAESMEKELGSGLNPSRTPADVSYFKNSEGNAEGSINIRSGKEGSKIDFVLGSWLSCNLPFGSLHISTLIAMLGPDTDAPHLLFEFIQNGQDSLVLVFDLLPRKDLVLEPEYLQRFYEETRLEAIRQELENAPESERYISSSLYVRSVVSPTALLFKVNGISPSGKPIEGGIERVISELLHPAVKKAFGVWLQSFQTLGRQVTEQERSFLVKRDEQIMSKGVEVDLSANMPRLFGQKIADRVVAAFRKRE
ncbi:hypothetical protein O6H91_17G049700 [Diphasiastrum complanatum]|uniref:Uncharacterized protein n=1 Tax=Diphasiastrum complanatum TaxID=34168 RepID=A0ACC2B6T6_DIPCM|nr:hypothetical protein O6H91_17G049700 [Diphasiastrum complanatum]